MHDSPVIEACIYPRGTLLTVENVELSAQATTQTHDTLRATSPDALKLELELTGLD